jgi:WD40 repeat protein
LHKANQEFEESTPQVLQVSAGGICAAADNKVHCFSLDLPAQQFTLKATLEVKQQGIADISIRQDQRLFATAGWDGKIRVFHYKKQKTLAVLQVSFVVSFFRARACDIISLN